MLPLLVVIGSVSLFFVGFEPATRVRRVALPSSRLASAGGRARTGAHHLLRLRLAVVAAWLLILLVATLTAAARSGEVSVAALASSPRKLAAGKFWLLVSNGVIVQRPVGLSLVSFALLIVFTLKLCGPRITFAAAAVGHVASTVLAYALVGLVFLADPGAIRHVASAPDYGVSAMQAAWIGAIAAFVWRREGQTLMPRALVVVGCAAIACLAWRLRPDLTLLDLDHLFAFAIGVGIVASTSPGAARRAAWKSVAGRRRFRLKIRQMWMVDVPRPVRGRDWARAARR